MIKSTDSTRHSYTNPTMHLPRLNKLPKRQSSSLTNRRKNNTNSQKTIAPSQSHTRENAKRYFSGHPMTKSNNYSPGDPHFLTLPRSLADTHHRRTPQRSQLLDREQNGSHRLCFPPHPYAERRGSYASQGQTYNRSPKENQGEYESVYDQNAYGNQRTGVPYNLSIPVTSYEQGFFGQPTAATPPVMQVIRMLSDHLLSTLTNSLYTNHNVVNTSLLPR
ncbi:unnamed protein product [Heterobilharzia americana]|nr:unnamed protein product [Heterobilharzia americana]